ncbi:MAG: hypothetical protein ACYCZV_16595, partial [Acidimicrobiales bacterium]
MTPPKVTRAQLLPLLERALDGAEAGRHAVVVVHADPEAVPQVGEVRGRAVSVRGSRSPLEIRSLLREPDRSALVVLTDCDPTALGDDVLARVFRHRVQRIDRWETVCQLFGAERATAPLVRKPHLADALIEATPVAGYPQLTTRVLDLETATAALLSASLGLTPDVVGLAGVLRWLTRPEAVGRIANARGEVLADLGPALRSRFGPGSDAVLAALAADKAADLVPLGIVAGVVHAPPADEVVAIVRLDERLGATGLDGDTYRAWGRAAEEVVLSADDPALA